MGGNDQRADANRANAQKSTGPKNTTSTRYNAVKHGLLSVGVTELDHPESYHALCAQLESEFKPVGEVETFLVRQRIALYMLRIRRASLLEAEFLTAVLNPPITETKILRKAEDAFPNSFDVTETVVHDPGLPAKIPPDNIATLANTFGRYETSFENGLYRALHELERLQRLRCGERVPPPSTIDVAIHGGGDQVGSFGNPLSHESATGMKEEMRKASATPRLLEPPWRS
jgi:hypothetical protein